ncbi:DNA cytosine methyltransferase [Mycolicibacterium farcinogenes]|uniref:DNA cytosine methyltransferase n=1 Tax=Mycolicibacterium farcinogenes TaxID=1802 RepID=A0ACD1FR77_MYCFR|nr:DNA cytosine methyltransferase [Mycolicibacterium farcinogenes]QZH69415.1 DNA cytosine methyltransferase [Mycolicibacterium farcinogenes]
MLEIMDWFCGAGGSSQGMHAVPHVRVTKAANHWDKAIESHAANFPDTDHYLGDIREAPVAKWPVADIFWASPECPQWSTARGKKRDFDATLQGDLFDTPRDEEADRSRALMEEVPMYLRGVIERGGRVRAGVVENVVEVRAWDQWDRWIGEIRSLGYRTRVIAMNSMHAQPGRTLPAPQSRDRLYVAYWDKALRREPDWDKWLRPRAYCTTCDEWIDAIQVFKKPGADMGRYRSQYVYRCPHVACRNAIVEPPAMPAADAIDWTLPGERLGDKPLREFRNKDTGKVVVAPLAPKTMARITAGIERYWAPFITEHRHEYRVRGVDVPLQTVAAAGNHFGLAVPIEGRDGKVAAPVELPLRTATTRNETALVVPCGGTWRDAATTANVPISTRTTRESDGIAFPPFVAELRGGASDVRSVNDPLATVTASGNHHGLITSYYGNGSTHSTDEALATVTAIHRHALLMRNNGVRGGHPARHTTPIDEPARTVTTSGHQSLLTAHALPIDLSDVLFRMLEPHEIGRAMAFGRNYVVLGNKRQRVRQYGNAVTPPVAGVIVSALVEAITGETIERWPHDLAAA